MILKFDSFIDA